MAGAANPDVAHGASRCRRWAGRNHACHRGPHDLLRCLGKNNAGQLGDGTIVTRPEPVEVIGLGSVRDFDVHGEHSCAVTSLDGALACWGRNLEGQLGDGTLVDRSTPARVVADAGGEVLGATAITAGRRHACALVDDRVACWGENLKGQLGDGTTVNRARAVEPGLARVIQLEAGREHTCARDVDGAVWCWGENAQGQVADPAGGIVAAPRRVALPGPASDLALGHNHTCALIGDAVWCWGKNAEAQIADPPSPAMSLPARAGGLPAVVRVAAGFNNTCAIAATGEIWCRGSNSEGQLGNGEAGPTVVAGSIEIPVSCL